MLISNRSTLEKCLWKDSHNDHPHNAGHHQLKDVTRTCLRSLKKWQWFRSPSKCFEAFSKLLKKRTAGFKSGCASAFLNKTCKTPDLFFPLIYETKYRKPPNHNRSEPQLTQTRSSELSELMERNLWFMIKTTRHAFPSVFCLSLDETWSILTLNLRLRHAQRLWGGGVD